MSDRLIPLSIRSDPEAAEAFSALQEGVPGHLRNSLVSWLRKGLPNAPTPGYTWPGEPMLEFIERGLHWDLGDGSHVARFECLMSRIRTDDDSCLDLIDYSLQSEWLYSERATALRDILELGGSAWTVGDLGGRVGLERRVDETTAATFRAATAIGDNASTHLRKAWEAAFGRDPEPNLAFQEAVAALEAVFDAVVLPNDPSPTLGKIEQAIKAKPEKWVTRLTDDQVSNSGVLAVREILRNIWRTQERHGSSKPGAPTSCTLEEAQDAVVAAAALVQLARQGGFKATPLP